MQTNNNKRVCRAPTTTTSMAAPTAVPNGSKKYTLKRFKDQVYGHIELPALCVAFIDTPQFQRLRLLKQLGAGYFVFPGASHNRFEHCIGVAWLAGVLMRKIQLAQPELEISDQDVELVQLTGLVHDLGHGPFSHLFDTHFLQSHKLTHEDMTLRVLDHLIADNGLNLEDLFGLDHEAAIQFIRHSISDDRGANVLAHYPAHRAFMLDVVHNCRNGLDVDRLDYFERDALNTGMKSMCDVERLFSEVRVIESEMCFPTKFVEDVLAAYRTRFSLFRSVYSHKVVKAIELMIVDSLLLADEEGAGVFPWKLRDCAQEVALYCETNDDVLQQIKRSKSQSNGAQKARALVKRLETRNLYRLMGEIPVEEKQEEDDGCSGGGGEELFKLKDDEWTKRLLDIATAEESDLLRAEHFRVEHLEINFGTGAENPISSVSFYSKFSPQVKTRGDAKAIACCPSAFRKRAIRIFCTVEDLPVQHALARAMRALVTGRGAKIIFSRPPREEGMEGGEEDGNDF